MTWTGVNFNSVDDRDPLPLCKLPSCANTTRRGSHYCSRDCALAEYARTNQTTQTRNYTWMP